MSDAACVTLYRYGTLAWVWRGVVLAGLGIAALFLFLASSLGYWWPLAGGLGVGALSIALPWMVAVRIDASRDGSVIVTNLLFARRHILCTRLGPPRLRRVAHGSLPTVRAPRVWIPVRGGWPIYIDLLGTIPDPNALAAVFKIPRNSMK